MSAWDDDFVLTALSTMARSKQLAFGILVLERLHPYVQSFAATTGWNSSAYVKGRSAIWDAATKPIDLNALRALAEECLESAPDTNDYADRFTSDALNGVLIANDLLEFLIDGNEAHLEAVSKLAKNSVFTYADVGVRFVTDPKEVIALKDSHPLMRAEVDRQRRDIVFLSELPSDITDKDVVLLKQRAAEAPALLGVHVLAH
jgi:hypothetical protein